MEIKRDRTLDVVRPRHSTIESGDILHDCLLLLSGSCSPYLDHALFSQTCQLAFGLSKLSDKDFVVVLTKPRPRVINSPRGVRHFWHNVLHSNWAEIRMVYGRDGLA